ncbi:YbjN domain-containing protein [Psychrobacter immobilis]|uniref:YbjN domain-containing protein n=1 Tax=Psychrobacter immobilis TaxID=498 RepID=UPI00191880A8|nr:YbjN domain-containing protein [Psychrobacter immobilis]
MSQRNKLSLWQKIRRFLTASAPPSIVNGTKKPSPLSPDDANTLYSETHHALNSDIGSERRSHPNSDANANANIDIDIDIDSTDLGSESDAKNDHKYGQTVSANLNSEQQASNNTPIIDVLKQYFDSKQWHYTHYQPKTNDSHLSHHLSLRMRHKQLNCGYLFRVQEKTKLLAVYGILPFLIPENHQNAAMLLITQLNYDMLIGNLEMDVNDGEIRYKNAIDVEVVGINDDTIEHLLQSVIAMTTVAHELFFDLVNNPNPTEDLQTLMLNLRQQADARTFFLPTQFVQ